MVAPTVPSDRGNGLAMRVGFFLDAYSRCFAVDLVIAPVAGRGEITGFVRSRVHRLVILDGSRPDSHYALLASVRDSGARLEAFRRYGRPSLASFIGSASDTLAAVAAENRYDAVHISRLYIAELAAPWIDRGAEGPCLVLDCDENDTMAYQRMASLERLRQNPIAAAWAEAEAQAFSVFATSWLPKFDLVFAASQSEARSLSAFGIYARPIPNVAAEAPITRLSRPRGTYSVLFVGTLSYPPNADAVTWFVSRIWRRLSRALDYRVRLIIVGANPPPAVARFRLQRGIEVTGAVADVSRYYREADLVVAPIRAGGGTRIKIMEAAAHGVPVVATGFAAEGTTFRHGVDILIANDERSFLRSCLLLAHGRSLSARLAKRARIKAKRDYSPAYWRARVLDLVS